MSARAVIAEIVADIMQTGHLTPDHLHIAGQISASGGITDLLAYIFAAARRKRIDLEAIDAAVALLGSALDDARIAINSGNPRAPGHLAAVHQAVARQLARGGLPDEVVVRIAHAFTRAQLDPGAPLLDAIEDAAADAGDDDEPPSREDLEEHMIGLAHMMGEDPFDIFAELSAVGTLARRDEHGAMAAMLSDAPLGCLRVASLGFALNKDADAAGEALGGIVSNGAFQSGDRASSRLRIMRPWLAAHRHPAIDEAIAAFAGLEKDQVAPAPASLVHLYCSCTDGAGSTSIFAIAKGGRKHMLIGVLVKRSAGVDDAWAHTGMTKAEVDLAVEKIVEGTGAYKVSMTLARRILADALAVNVAQDSPPPFGLLLVCERLGLGEVLPQRVTTEALIDEALAGLSPGRTDQAAVRMAHQRSANWANRMRTLESWFEAGPELHAALKKLRTPQRRVQAVLEQFLPARRAFWARNCAWAAAILRDAATGRDETWIDMALVARALTSDVPLAEIPLTVGIAELTVRAHYAAG